MSVQAYWQVRKTDKRMNGSMLFEYVAKPAFKSSDSLSLFKIGNQSKIMLLEARKWCWENFGPSCELPIHLDLKKGIEGEQVLNPRWTWDTFFNNNKLYFQTEKEKNWFLLRWS
jgi:hypothetical protein